MSAGMYGGFNGSYPHSELITWFLESKPGERGEDPGSAAMMRKSGTFLVRTKALQDHSHLTYPQGDAIAPLNPKFASLRLRAGDILVSKDSNVGEAAVVDEGLDGACPVLVITLDK